MLSMGWVILIFVVGILLGAIGGFFLARNYMKKYFSENPPITEDMMRVMMMQMGQKPSQKKLNQVMTAMRNQQTK